MDSEKITELKALNDWEFVSYISDMPMTDYTQEEESYIYARISQIDYDNRRLCHCSPVGNALIEKQKEFERKENRNGCLAEFLLPIGGGIALCIIVILLKVMWYGGNLYASGTFEILQSAIWFAIIGAAIISFLYRKKRLKKK